MTERQVERIRPNREACCYLDECLALGKGLRETPKIALALKSRGIVKGEVDLQDIAVSAARECYFRDPAQIRQRRSERDYSLADNTLEQGHLTTRGHAYLTFKIEGVSRNVVHEVLHRYPFYNTSQKSQRYAEIKVGSVVMPASLSEEQSSLYTEAVDHAGRAYRELVESDNLVRAVEDGLTKSYGSEGWRKLSGINVGKLCQESVRYVLPIGQMASMDHTINQLTLIRLFRDSQLPNFNDEARFVIASMVKEVAKSDPTIQNDLRVLNLNNVERVSYDEDEIRKWNKDFDGRLAGEPTVLVAGDNDRKMLADAIRGIRGVPESVLTDEEALRLALNPEENNLLADVFEAGIDDPLTSSLEQGRLGFITKLSHTADSQRQRQRMTPGATPPIEATYCGEADYIVPGVVERNEQLRQRFVEIMETQYDYVRRLVTLGTPKEWALYLLPNAHALRITETGGLMSWNHRFKDRICNMAQEEIRAISVRQAAMAEEVYPEAVFGPKCVVREVAGIKPRCPEKARSCVIGPRQWLV